jgi:hypothetical protein
MPFQRLRRAASRLFRAAARPPRRARDTQRSRLYRWEAAAVLPHVDGRLTLEACQRLVTAVFEWAEAPATGETWRPPRVTDGRGRRHACGSREVIKLPVWARTPAVVLHECAHGIARDQHGPEFVAVYIVLLARFLAFDEVDLGRSAQAAGLRLANAHKSSAVATLTRRQSGSRSVFRAPH